jgi:trigger factor
MKATLLSKTPHQRKLQFQLSPAEVGTDPLTAMQQTVARYLRDQALEPCREPQLRRLSEGPSGLSFACELELFPAVDLPDSLQIATEVRALQAPQAEQLESALRDLRLALGDMRPVTRPARWGDLLIVDLVGSCQQRLIPMSACTYWQLMLPATPVADAFLNQLIGLEAGQVYQLAHVLPDDYAYAPWRKARATYHVYVHHVLEAHVPPADDTLAQRSGHWQTLDQLIAAFYQEQRLKNCERWLADCREQVVRELVRQSRVALPPAWVETEFRAAWEQGDAQALARQSQLKIASELQRTGWQSWQTHTHLKQLYAETLKTQLVLRTVAQREGITLTWAERDQVLNALAEERGMTPAQLNALLQENQLMEQLLGQLLLGKVARHLLKQARLSVNGQPL